jgi:quinol monooxygenase YgiN
MLSRVAGSNAVVFPKETKTMTNNVSTVTGQAASPITEINSVTNWSQDDKTHPGFVTTGEDNTPGHKAYYIHLEAKPGQEDALQKFLADINAGVDQEPLTGPWFAVRYSKSTFGIFEAFPDADARHTHDNGPGRRNFLRSEHLHEMLGLSSPSLPPRHSSRQVRGHAGSGCHSRLTWTSGSPPDIPFNA